MLLDSLSSTQPTPVGEQPVLSEGRAGDEAMGTRARPWRAFLPVLGLYWLLRALILFSNFDEVSLPAFELSPMGIIARIAETGWRGAPLASYYDNCGGHLLVGILAAPIFKLVGASYMALKLVPLLLGSASLFFLWDIARRLFGKRAALVTSLAFCLGAETLLVYSVLVKGNHFEGLTLQLGCTWLWVRGYQSSHPGRWWRGAALLAGLSVFVYSGSLIWIALLAMAHAAGRASRRGVIELLRGSLPFLIGLLPLAWIGGTTGKPQRLIRSYFREFDPAARFERFCLEILPESAGFSDLGSIPGGLVSAAWMCLALVTWLAVAWLGARRILARRREQQASPLPNPQLQDLALLPILGYFPVFVLVFLCTTFEFDAYSGPVALGQYRYLVPHFAFSCLLLGYLAEAAPKLRSAAGRLCGSFLVWCPILIGAIFGLGRVDWSFEDVDAGLRYAGYDYADAVRPLLRQEERDPSTGRVSWDLERVRRELNEFEGEDRERVAFGLGRGFAQAQALERREKGSKRLDLRRILDPLPAELRVHGARGVGAAIMMEPSLKQSLAKILEQVQESDPEHARHVVEGLTSAKRGALSNTTERVLLESQKQRAHIPSNLRRDWRRGQGFFCGMVLGRGLERDEVQVRSFLRRTPENRGVFWAGVEQAWNRSRRRHESFDAMRAQIEADL